MIYSFFFTHLEHLAQAADEESAGGNEKGAAELRTHVQRASGLTTDEGELLERVSSDCNTTMKETDAAIEASVTDFQDQHPDGELLTAPIPPELRSLWEERIRKIESHVDELKQLLGEERFLMLDTYVSANFSPVEAPATPAAHRASPSRAQ